MDLSTFSGLFERVRHGAMSPKEAAEALRLHRRNTAAATPAGEPVQGAEERVWGHADPYLQDHLVDGVPVLIGATSASLAVDHFFRRQPAARGLHVHGLDFMRPVQLAPSQRVRVLARSTLDAAGIHAFEAVARLPGDAEDRVIATGRLEEAAFLRQPLDLAARRAALAPQPDVSTLYPHAGTLQLGPSFRTFTQAWLGAESALVHVALMPGSEQDPPWGLHPLLLNSAFVAAAPLVAQRAGEDLFLPFGIRHLYCARPASPRNAWLSIELVKTTPELVLFDADFVDDTGHPIARLEACALKRRRAFVPASAPAPVPKLVPKPAEPARPAIAPHDDGLRPAIQAYITAKIAGAAKLTPHEIDPRRNIMDMGLESAQLVALGAEIRDDLDVELYPTLFFEYTNVAELTEHFHDTHRAKFEAYVERTGTAATSKRAAERIPQAPAEPVEQRPAPAFSPAPHASREPIAIIGMHGRFAGADDLAEFWRHLDQATDLMREVPPDHWDIRPWFDPDPQVPDRTYCKWGSFIDGVDRFDAPFFNISRREAEWMDPQVRLLLQSVHAAAEDAGLAPGLRGSRTGVFIGACFHDYQYKIDEYRIPVNPHMGVNNTHTALANRVSYHFDLNGPSVTVDTACSSSLVALHQACVSLRNGECDIALVSGVNLLLSSMHYRVFSSLRALSPTGRCHSFDASADGYVPGECIATVLLKPLSQALRDGDRIEAVIRGSAALHGGYTPSFTAPSVAGEQNVVLKAWEDAGIDVETITYLEAHGTGTRLGDPIEVNALKNAFAVHTEKQGFCAIGSAKANIGHTEGAAGLAGVLKVLLQMKHQRIPPLMGFRQLNPYLSLEGSALRLDPAGAQWTSPPGVPRRAGVSSFGVAGAYAHVVLEEYLAEAAPAAAAPEPPAMPVAIVLSARTEPALRAQAQRLHDFIVAGRLARDDLADAASTLQTGRQEMEFRLAILSTSVDDVRQKLQAHLQGLPVEGLYQGQARRREASGQAMSEQDMRSMTSGWIKQGELGKLLSLWVAGFAVNWAELNGGRRSRRIALPTYPFAGERYWVPESEIPAMAAPAAAPAATPRHPLLQENLSSLAAPAFRAHLHGDEPFLADHVVRGDSVLPGVVHLEMAHAALAQALGGAASPAAPLALENVVWMRPVVVDAPLAIRVDLRPGPQGPGGPLAYEVSADEPGSDGKRIIFSQGRAQQLAAEARPKLDLAALLASCSQSTMPGADCYRLISEMGLDLGPSLRGLHAVHLGDGQVLAHIERPDDSRGSHHAFTLHPGVLDAALQACACLLLASAPSSTTPWLALPFALRRLAVMAPTTARMWAFVRGVDANTAEAGVREVDIDLCDESGLVCVRLSGLEFRLLPRTGSGAGPAPAATGGNTSPPTAVLLARPVWTPRPAEPTRTVGAYAARAVVACDIDDALTAAQRSAWREAGAELAVTDGLAPAAAYGALAEHLLGVIQRLFAQSADGPVLLQVACTASAHSSWLRGLSALLKTAQQENPRFRGQLIELDATPESHALAALLREEAATADDHVSHHGGQRRVRMLQELPASSRRPSAQHPWRDGGTYLLTGGAGGLGLLLARDIARLAHRPTLVLAGRSPLDAARQAAVAELQSLGARAEYRRLDVTDRSAVRALVKDLSATHGAIHGVVHVAGLLRDEPIRRRTAGGLAPVMGPKVDGLVHLDEATRDEPLEVFIAFSSIAAAFGNAGQADYATGNAFMDAHAAHRQALVDSGRRHGRTLAVNWPLWQEGAMRPDAATETLLRDSVGLQALDTRAGLDALYQALQLEAPQVVILAGDPERLRSRLLRPQRTPAPQVGAAGSAAALAAAPAAGGLPGGDCLAGLRRRTLAAVSRRAADVLKMPVDEIDVRAELDTYGFNSIAITEFVNTINREFGLALTPTIFYEHSTLARFGDHLVAAHAEAMAAKLPAPRPAAGPEGTRAHEKAAPAVALLPLPVDVAGRSTRATPAAALETHPRPADEPIAIVGLSGAFPMAADLDAFWNRLHAGDDCIQEIPSARWDWQAMYGDPQQPGNHTNVKWGGFIDGIDEFDPLFFGISPREAALMDPQQRLLLIHAWRAIEDAGHAPGSLAGTRTAVFVGTTATGYGELLNRHGCRIEACTATGLVPSVGPNRLSYLLDLRGPSEPIETACSSALVAIHRGVEALRHGRCELALVGGVNTILLPELHVSFNRAGMLSQDGRCKAFSAKGDGFARGEGAGMMVLKRLSAAERDGDVIHGLVRATAMNHGGRAKSLTAPSPRAQADLLKEAYTAAGIDPSSVGYVEAHGTGTALGDPIEVEGLKLAFRELAGHGAAHEGGATARCGLGSVKSNIGHLELAAGVAGVFKVLLQMRHRTLVPTLHCEEVNPYLRLEDSPFFLVREAQPWPAPQGTDGQPLPRRAGISSFGFGGTNCHVVLEEYVDRRPAAAPHTGDPLAFLLSARDGERLREQASRLRDHLRDKRITDDRLADIAHTLQVGRDAMTSRLAVLAGSVEELLDRLEAFLEGRAAEGIHSGRVERRDETLALFADDEELRHAAGRWLQQRDYAKLLRLWVRGLAVDWSQAAIGSGCRRVSLPTYPFARETYWVDSAGAAPRDATPEAPPEKAPARQEPAPDAPQPVAPRFLETTWQQAPELPAAAPARRGTPLILATPETRALAAALQRRLPTADIRQSSDLHPGDVPSATGLIDLSAAGSSPQDPLTALPWLQELVAAGQERKPMLIVLTRAREAGADEAHLASPPEAAARAALYRLLPSEYRHVAARHVEVPSTADDETVARWLAAEYEAGRGEPAVSYREGRRHVPVLAENTAWAGHASAVGFDSECALWITGGTGGLGLRLAEHFVQRHGVRRLVLTGRQPVPARDEWARHELENTPTGKRVRAFLQFEKMGVQLIVSALDLTDGESVGAFMRRIHATLGRVGGVLHAAGAVSQENTAFVRKSVDEMGRVLAPKVAGLKTLFDHVRGEPLRFLALFSSVSAVLPTLGAGLSDYAMANAHLDAFARAHAATCPVVSLQWPRWKESPLGAQVTAAYDRTGLPGLADEEGLALLDAVLAHRAGPVVMPLVAGGPEWQPQRLLVAGGEVSAPVAPPVPPAPAALSQNVEDRRLEDWLVAFFASELRIPAARLRLDVPFQDYGMESVMLAQIVGRIERELPGLRLDPSAILAHPTLGELAGHLRRSHPDLLARLPGPAPKEPTPPTAGPAPSAPAESSAEVLAAPMTPEPSPAVRAPGTPPAAAGRIAVIGLAAHLPDAPDIATFWANLAAGRDSIREVPATRWDIGTHYRPDAARNGQSISKWGAFLEGIEDFDPAYFQLTDAQAIQMDPLERQWLEVGTEALADAGYGDRRLWGHRVGVFVGARTSNYRDKLSHIDKDVVVGLGQNFIAAHLAHVGNFKGPNFVVDAACASALTAVHLAVQSLRRGESEVAIAGGVEILLDESPYIVLSTAQVLSPDGRCRTFDERANGIGLGEGCAAVVLKPLERAIADGDKIYGVIDGSAINNDGRTMGITTPNPQAQADLIRQALADAGARPSSVSYVEAHGTGTLIGDPIELGALSQVFPPAPGQPASCGVGSVKSNLGHLLSAAGAASLTKVLLSLAHRQLPPTLHCDRPNPRFNFEESTLYPVRSLTAWPGVRGVRRAGISSFGLGGNNAHLVVSDEGVPDALRADLEPRGQRVVFRRHRCWPEPRPSARLHLATGIVPVPAPPQPSARTSPRDRDLVSLFDVREVSSDHGAHRQPEPVDA